MNRSLKQRNGLRVSKPRKRRMRLGNNYSRDLYYLTEALKNIVGIITQAVIIGVSLMLVGVGLMRAVYLLG